LEFQLPWTKAEIDAIVAEKPFSKERIYLACEKHGYVASSTPPQSKGCRDCWMAYWTNVIVTSPPHLRLERLASAEKAVRAVVDSVESGTFDFIPLEHPEVSIERDVNPTQIAKERNEAN
jgi:hypothetical protein